MRPPKKVRLYGAGGHSQIIQLLLNQNNVLVSEVFDDNPLGCHPQYKNVKPGCKNQNSDFKHAGYPFIIAVGDNHERYAISKILKCKFYNAIHGSAIICSSAKIGNGAVVYAGAIIQHDSIIGNHTIINTSANIGHNNRINDYAHVSPKATLCDHVEVGEGAHIGAGALIIPKIKIGKWSIIGAGAVVLKDVPNYAVVVGNPGKVIKINKPLS